jgi:NAD(P)-dependent dehydrogenase (short-subunit alcohol dehydrogenase family)
VSNSENQAPPLGAAVQRFDLSDRVVVVAGASKGIGRELTIALAETGAVVVPTVRIEADAESITAEAQSQSLTVHPQRLDIRDAASINEADWDQMMAVHLRGAFFMSQAAARAMGESGRGGRIVNISSQGSLVGLRDAAVYCAARAA